VVHLEAELANFDFKISANTGHDTYEAASSGHDDILVSLALSAYWLRRQSRGESFVEAWRMLAIEDQAERRGIT
jgi:hypothetical protein